MFLYRISDNLNNTTRIAVVQTLALSLINYCSKIWGMTTKSQLERVQRLQNFAAKVAIGGARKYDHVTPIFNKLEWLKIEQKVSYDICITVFKVLKVQLSEWLFSLSSPLAKYMVCVLPGNLTIYSVLELPQILGHAHL